MHIGLVIYGSLDTLSGGYLYDRKLVSFLQQAGHEVEIVSLPWRSYLRHLTDNLSQTVWQRLTETRFDLLLQDELNHPSLAWLNQRLQRHGAYPIISIVHHLRSSEAHARALLPLYRTVEKQYLQTVDGFIFNSETTRETVQALVPAHKPSIIAYPAADHRQPPSSETIAKKLAQRAMAQGPLQILFVGNVIARKGLHHLLTALVNVPRPLWHLHVVGSLMTDVIYVGRIHHLIDDLNLTDAVTLHGALDDERLHHLYRQSDLFAAPGYEGFGIVYLEAMSFGLPVLASTAGAAHEIVSHAQTGFLTSPTDIATLTAQLTHCCQDRQLVTTMGAAARQRYEAHPTWQQTFHPLLPWLEDTYDLR